MPVERMWQTHDLKPAYDVVIIGAGVHGLAIAYYLGIAKSIADSKYGIVQVPRNEPHLVDR